MIQDRRLENSVDRAARIYQRMDLGNEEHLPGYGYSGKGPKNYQKKDQQILEEVCEILFKSYDVDASDIEVDVKDGVVHLTGKVENRYMKRAAEDRVDEVAGVKDVRNELEFERKLTQR